MVELSIRFDEAAQKYNLILEIIVGVIHVIYRRNLNINNSNKLNIESAPLIFTKVIECISILSCCKIVAVDDIPLRNMNGFQS